MKITMNTDKLGVYGKGVFTRELRKGQTYSVPSEVDIELAKAYISRNEAIEYHEPTPPENKKIQPVEEIKKVVKKTYRRKKK